MRLPIHLRAPTCRRNRLLFGVFTLPKQLAFVSTRTHHLSASVKATRSPLRERKRLHTKTSRPHSFPFSWHGVAGFCCVASSGRSSGFVPPPPHILEQWRQWGCRASRECSRPALGSARVQGLRDAAVCFGQRWGRCRCRRERQRQHRDERRATQGRLVGERPPGQHASQVACRRTVPRVRSAYADVLCCVLRCVWGWGGGVIAWGHFARTPRHP